MASLFRASAFSATALLPALLLGGCATDGQAAAKDLPGVLADIREACAAEGDREACLQAGIVRTAAEQGPELATKALDALRAEGDLQSSSDYHDLSHKIGRETAKTLGVQPSAFLRCPTDYNYGCPHGFFEQALVTEPDAVAAAEKICDPEAFEGMAAKSLFYCFHGVGHGVMMANAYDLQASLETCDEFGGASREGCWQGVFMENVNGQMKGESSQGGFSETDPLAPCNAISPQYRWQCYINHAAYLLARTGNSVRTATEACLRAEPQDRDPCLESIGLMATNPGWQRSLLPDASDSVERNAAAFCSLFPRGYEDRCIRAGVDNLQNFDRTSTARSAAFCGELPQEHHVLRYGRIGSAVRGELPEGNTDTSVCDPVPEQYRSLCLSALR